MTTYITQEQAMALFAKYANGVITHEIDVDEAADLLNAAIQAYRNSLVAGMVLPEPVGFRLPEQDIADKYVYFDASEIKMNAEKLERIYTADQLRQAIADALAKQRLDNVLTKRARNPMFEFRECEDSKAGSHKLEKQLPPSHIFKRYEKDDTEYNGAVYYLASEVDAALVSAPDPKEAV